MYVSINVSIVVSIHACIYLCIYECIYVYFYLSVDVSITYVSISPIASVSLEKLTDSGIVFRF